MGKFKGLSILEQARGMLFACAIGLGLAAGPALSAETEITVSTWGGRTIRSIQNSGQFSQAGLKRRPMIA